jgi:putative Mn2+ efflux pump MntP
MCKNLCFLGEGGDLSFVQQQTSVHKYYTIFLRTCILIVLGMMVGLDTQLIQNVGGSNVLIHGYVG